MINRSWYRRTSRDALDGYQNMSLELRGAYNTILDLLYDGWEPICRSDRWWAGQMDCSVRKWVSVRDELVKLDKIMLAEDGTISNSRFEFEAENVLKESRQRAESGAKGGRKKHEKSKKSNKNKETDLAPLEQTSSDKIREDKKRIDKNKNNDFDGFWSQYPHPENKGGKKKANQLYDKALLSTSHDELMLAVQNYSDWLSGGKKDEFRPSPAMAQTWLQQERWESWLESTQETFDPAYWKAVLSQYKKGTFEWSESKLGPPPGQEGCRVPSEQLTEFLGG